MARHTAKSHKIRKVEILVIQIQIVVEEGHMRYRPEYVDEEGYRRSR